MSDDEARERAHEDMLRQRGVRDPCETCRGYGVCSYGNTSTWRRGVGGAAITRGVCDVCWGSGDADPERAWLDLRTLDEWVASAVAERALHALEDACGARLTTTKPSVMQIVEVLEKLANGRKTSFWTAPLAQGLANILRRAVGEPEVKNR